MNKLKALTTYLIERNLVMPEQLDSWANQVTLDLIWKPDVKGLHFADMHYSATIVLERFADDPGRLIALLGQLGTHDVILVVQSDTRQNSHRHRGSNCQAANALPVTALGFGGCLFFGQCGRYCRCDVQARDQQIFVHHCTGNLVAIPGGTCLCIVKGIQYPT